MNELSIDGMQRESWKEDLADGLMDAIDLASDQDQMTWLTSDGKRVAAILPVADAEEAAVRFEPEPPFDENHYRYHSPARPLESCAWCRWLRWLR